jgi:hypothetical protein
VTEAQWAVERRQPPKGPFVVINAVIRGLLRSPAHGLVGDRIGLLTFTGAKTGTIYRTPVGVHDLDGEPATLTSSGWRVNFRNPAPVTLHRAGRDLPLFASLIEDPDQVADVYATLIDRFGYQRAGRRLGIKITVDRTPTHQELADSARHFGLSVVSYQPRPEPTTQGGPHA